MNNSKQLFIPDRINVGFQNRDDTYTKKLAYVTYFDNKGVLRKEKSWNGWRNNKIKPIEFANEPTEGFVLNKGVGGARRSYGWNVRNEYIRVYDPRDFEFEISIANLLFILRECDCSRGKGLEGKFVYAWEGTELVLLPATSEEFKQSKSFTSLQAQSVKAKDLIPGATYTTKKQEQLTFVGKFDHYFVKAYGRIWDYSMGMYRLDCPKADSSGVIKKFVFWNGKNFVLLNELKSIAVMTSDAVHPSYASLVDGYNRTAHASKVVKLSLGKLTKNEPDRGRWFFEESDGVFLECATNYTGYTTNRKISHIRAVCKYFINEQGLFTKEYCSKIAYAPKALRHSSHPNDAENMPWREPTNVCLYATTENGQKFRVDYDTFNKER
jgi:hypothetical protein